VAVGRQRVGGHHLLQCGRGGVGVGLVLPREVDVGVDFFVVGNRGKAVQRVAELSEGHCRRDQTRLGTLGDYECASADARGMHAGERLVAVVPPGEHFEHDRVVQVRVRHPLP
jgi:hypothetical protein